MEDDIIVDPVESPEIVDDFEIAQDEAVEIKDKFANKLRRRVDQYKVSGFRLSLLIADGCDYCFVFMYFFVM